MLISGKRKMILHNKISYIGVKLFGRRRYWSMWHKYVWFTNILDHILIESKWYIKSIPYKIERYVLGRKEQEKYELSHCPRLGFYSVTKITPEGRRIVVCTITSPIKILP